MAAIIIAAIAIGLLAGWLRAGRTLPDRLPLRGVGWIVLSLVLQVVALGLARPLGATVMAALLVSSILLLLVWVWQDRSTATVLVGVGLSLNLLVMIANDGFMPVPADALERQGYRSTATIGELPRYSKGRIADPASIRLPFLADVIESPVGGLFSVGDIVLAVGVGVLAWERLGRNMPQSAHQA